MNNTVKVVIEVRGGIVQDVYASDVDAVEVVLVDWDNMPDSGEPEAGETGHVGSMYGVIDAWNMDGDLRKEVASATEGESAWEVLLAEITEANG